jgi:hypothetical protein
MKKLALVVLVLAMNILPVLSQTNNDSLIRKEQEKLCFILLGIKADFSEVAIPQEECYGELVIIPAGLSYKQLLEAMAFRFPVSIAGGHSVSWLDSMDSEIVGNSYAIRTDNISSSQNRWRWGSFTQLKDFESRSENRFMTLKERLYLELVYWNNNQKHMDLNTITLCNTKLGANNIPIVYWRSSEVSEYSEHLAVGFTTVDDSGYLLRAREVKRN